MHEYLNKGLTLPWMQEELDLIKSLITSLNGIGL